MEVTLEMRLSDDLRNNDLYNQVLKGNLDTLEENWSRISPENHLDYVRNQAKIEALRLLHSQLMAPSELIEN